ncbi:tetratricopeptide repeat-containing sensor histidine kinase [Mucilaginibacter sp.]|uniref:tetratricopeptide repeat-containing sensor histidine kinase n=1 Tax=Mucilaginibacter sp. TaxID=1882438 RepID=UPI002627BA1D|nr:tetratricopeptide repeat-containing sensor histidine kinase [Mucilaginibacter sp.]MDB5030873.1 walK 3 [Mucilaginibacter sp.]
MICQERYSAYKITGHKLLFCVLLLAINSCKPKNTDPIGYSDDFKPILNKVDTLFGTNRVDKGLYVLDSALSRISKPTIEDKFRTYGFHYVYYHKTKGDNKKALLYADSMLNVANQSITNKQYVALYAEANFAIGDAYFSMQQYNAAYQHFFQGYMVGKNNLNRKALAEYMYRMGMITYKMGNYKFATDYFKKSYGYHSATTNEFVTFYNIQELLDNIALSYKHNNQPDSAIVYFNKALNFLDEYGSQFKDRLKMIDIAKGVVYGNKAEVLVLQGNYTEAIKLLKKSIETNLQKGYDSNDAQLTEIKLAQLYFDYNEDKALINLLNTIGPQLDTIKNAEAQTDWNRLMSKYYLRKKNLPKALHYLQTYNTLKDSNIKKLDLLRESDINKQLDSYEKQQQIEKLSSNNKVQLISLYVIIIFAVMALVIILLIYRNWIRSKKDVQTVNLLNKQINEQNSILENALNELKISSQEKDRILRTVAHDLRNPIGGIASLTSLMADDEYTEDQKELINLVKETSYNSLELIEEILEATNISSIELTLEQVEINSLVSNSVELLRFKAIEKGQKIFFEPLCKPQDLYICREKIWRVISNLISNAIKFSPTGASIFVKVTTQNDETIIAVKDNGIGIPDKLKDQVFNMFTTAQRPGTSGEKSFGLGLSICWQIMEKSYGKIWFDSDSKTGTTFFISFPLHNPDAPGKSPQQVSIPQS